MARTKTEIKNQITQSFIQNSTIVELYGVDPAQSFEQQFSLLSFENTLFEIFAAILLIFELIFDTHRTEVYTILSEKKPHTARWYRNKALAFQYGFDLIEDTDIFENTGFTDDEISASKIIKYSAVTEAVTESRLIVKIATETGGELQPITDAEKDAFTAYMAEIKDAGVKITVINYLPDLLNLTMKIYRDPLVLNENGIKITGAGAGTKPVETAIKNYLKNLPFNGELTLQSLVDALQIVEGVKIAHIVSASSSWIDPVVNSYGAPQNIDVKKIPVSGYFKLENFSGITYIV